MLIVAPSKVCSDCGSANLAIVVCGHSSPSEVNGRTLEDLKNSEKGRMQRHS